MTKTQSRRQNMYPDTCRVCGAAVPAGSGWLYSDTSSSNSRSKHRAARRWLKVVKCDRCHNLKAVHRLDLPENQPAPLPTLGVGAIRQGKFRLGTYRSGYWTHTGVYLQLADGTRELVAWLDPIGCEPRSFDESLNDRGLPRFGNRALTTAASRELLLLAAYAADMYAVAMLDPRDAE